MYFIRKSTATEKYIANNSTDSGSDKQENVSKTYLRLRELLLQTNDTSHTKLSKDGKRIECLHCGKSSKLDKCKRTAAGHLKYFRRIHNCNSPKADEQPKKSMSISSLQRSDKKFWQAMKVPNKVAYSKQYTVLDRQWTELDSFCSLCLQ